MFREPRSGPGGKPSPTSLLAAVAVLAAALLTAAPAAAAQPVNVLPGTAATDVRAKLERDGALTVTERIAVPAGNPVHRTIPLRQPVADGGDRVFSLADVRLDGGDVQVGPDAVRLVLRPGEATFRYAVRGAVADDGPEQEVRWQFSGGWDVPVDRISASLLAPQVPRDITCLAGPVGGDERCDRYEIGRAQQVQALQFGLAPGDRLVLSIRVPGGAVPSNAVVERPFDPAHAFSPHPGAIAGVAGVGLLLIGALGTLRHLRRRDARTAAAATGPAEVLTTTAAGTTFTSPDGVLPGHVGTVLGERAELVDVAGTVVDLAVRNYLGIEELAADWRIVRRSPPDAALRDHERAVHDLLVGERDQVSLGELGRGDLAPVREALYAEVVARGWFARRPDAARNLLWWGGIGIALAGALLAVLLALTGPLGLIGVAVAVGGLVLTAASRSLPARTARGAVLAGRLRGLRAHLSSVPVATFPAADREAACFRALPYALVLGEVERWLAAWADLDAADAPVAHWYRERGAVADLAHLRAALPAFADRLCTCFAAHRSPPGSPEPVTTGAASR
ncbi:DUF2207 domain-containing protein [Saccharopolyspora sp. 6T]|uniref:DUF2207 family protein n=1 Tax=Saccharopolyspora sp. 6T TaxID=2877238 RepID=UPI001CD43002|nr:DUF2207 domain-containing protein [Saccharopolyspora sp. 6T]MCA1185521.1 DUF2207 domain-containing protein [Saccharopolyspora sp. 6T]